MNSEQKNNEESSTANTSAGARTRRKPIISWEDQQAVREAVARAEAKTAGEIMPVIARRSSIYPSPEWRGGIIGGLIAAVLMALLWVPGRLWGSIGAIDLLIPLMVSALGFLTGYFAVNLIAPLERLLCTRDEINEAVSNAVFREFMLNNLSATRERSGVLVYISLFERRVQILADAGINEKVEAGQWQSAVDGIVSGIRAGNMTAALCRAIDEIGDMLAVHFPVKPDDTNELGDLVLRD